MKELESFYQSCNLAPVPDLKVPKREPLAKLMLAPTLGLATGLFLALLLLVATPEPNIEEGSEAARAISQMQLAEVAPSPSTRPRAAAGVNWNA